MALSAARGHAVVLPGKGNLLSRRKRAQCSRHMGACATFSPAMKPPVTSARREPESDLVAPRTLARWWRGCGGECPPPRYLQPQRTPRHPGRPSRAGPPDLGAVCSPCNAHRIKRCRMTVLAWPEIERRLSFSVCGAPSVEARLTANIWKRREVPSLLTGLPRRYPCATQSSFSAWRLGLRLLVLRVRVPFRSAQRL